MAIFYEDGEPEHLKGLSGTFEKMVADSKKRHPLPTDPAYYGGITRRGNAAEVSTPGNPNTTGLSR